MATITPLWDTLRLMSDRGLLAPTAISDSEARFAPEAGCMLTGGGTIQWTDGESSGTLAFPIHLFGGSAPTLPGDTIHVPFSGLKLDWS
jgi:hypothetical protein